MARSKPTKVPVMKPNQMYENWRKELQIWKATNTALGVKPEVQAGCLFEALEGIPRQIVLSELSVGEISCEQEVQNIIEILNHFYYGNQLQKAYNALDDLLQFKHSPEQTTENFLTMFQLKVNQVKATGTQLSDGVLGYA